jgi:NTE family protein
MSQQKVDGNRNHHGGKEKQIGLVLQGGGALGAYEVGALKVIIKRAVQTNSNADGDFFNVVAGSSIGAINGAILIQEFVKDRSWTEAVNELQNFWIKQMATDSFVDDIPGFSEWWQYWSNLARGSIATSEAARRYYSSLQFWTFGIPSLFSSSTKFDNRFLDPQFNFLQRGDWSALGNMLENYKREHGFKLFPIKTEPERDPRLLTTAIDVKTGEGVIFDSYSSESCYPAVSYAAKTNTEKKKQSNQEIKIKYPDGLTKRHIMASAAIPANADFTIVDDINSIPHMYWDGAFASNTPLRGLIQSHRDWYLNHGGIVPDLAELYIIGLWPRTVRDLPVPPDNNFVWSRMWDLLFDDKTTYVEKTAEMVTDYLDIIEKLRPLAEENGHKGEVDKFLADLAHSRHRDGSYRRRQGLLEGRFKIGKIQRTELDEFQDASGLKIFDFSKTTIKELITQGEQDAMASSPSKK